MKRYCFDFALRLTLLMMLVTAVPISCRALDYEAKPVMWVLKAPFRAAGAVSGAVVGGGVSGPYAYPDRPDSVRVWYEMAYFPMRVISMLSAIVWDIPTASFQDVIKGAIGGTRMVARNLGKEDGVYELIAGGVTGGPVGLVAGSAYGVVHGLGYGAYHGFVGYPATANSGGSYCQLFQGRQYVVPYGDSY